MTLNMKANLTELQGEIDKSIIIEGDFHISNSVTARTREQKKIYRMFGQHD